MAATEKEKQNQGAEEGGNGPDAETVTAAEAGPAESEEVAAPAPILASDEMVIEKLKQEVECLQQQLEESKDKTLRTHAEMENLRKRSARDMENAHKYALDKFMKELLPVIDSMELGISATDSTDDIKGIREGMDLTLKKFLDTLEKFGVMEVAAQGEKFDPEKHEAVSMQEIEGQTSGTVVAVMQKGYELNGRLVRPAMVVVAK